MNCYFISDAHLKPVPKSSDDKERQIRVVQFLEKITGEADYLVIAGDFFDLWYDWSNIVLSEFFPVYFALKQLANSGCKIKMVAGNHDFYFRFFLQKHLNIEVCNDSCSLEIDNKKVFVTHGDSHGQNDFRYKFYKMLIRSKIFELFFGIIHPVTAIKIGSLASRSSRNRKTEIKKLQRKESDFLKFAKDKIRCEEFDLVIMGHTHNPILEKIDKGFYANCGDWLTHNSYVQLKDGDISLNKFEN